ncbi:MAG: carboxypeptidase-like regulatory domain-containing protein, partial [Pedobacter sp.]|nr:carboxypeptidase-like regulatory domain-containing protein [Pedobacter sp.]
MIQKSLICLVFLLYSFSPASAQQKFTISGTIRDAATGETLIGATVKIQGATQTFGTSSNAYGFYSLTGNSGEYNLTVSYTGYEATTKKITLSTSAKFNFELKPDKGALDEVVITAGSRKNDNVRSPQMGLDKLNMKD